MTSVSRYLTIAALCKLLAADPVLLQDKPQRVERFYEYYVCVDNVEIWVEVRELYKVEGKVAGSVDTTRLWEQKRKMPPSTNQEAPSPY